MKRKLVFRRDLILFAVVGVLIILSVLIPKIKDAGEKYAVVTVDGETVYRERLSADNEITLDNGIKIKVENGEAYFLESDCKDKICIKSGKLKNTGDVAVCLPNKTVLTVKGEKSAFDAVTY